MYHFTSLFKLVLLLATIIFSLSHSVSAQVFGVPGTGNGNLLIANTVTKAVEVENEINVSEVSAMVKTFLTDTEYLHGHFASMISDYKEFTNDVKYEENVIVVPAAARDVQYRILTNSNSNKSDSHEPPIGPAGPTGPMGPATGQRPAGPVGDPGVSGEEGSVMPVDLDDDMKITISDLEKYYEYLSSTELYRFIENMPTSSLADNGSNAESFSSFVHNKAYNSASFNEYLVKKGITCNEDKSACKKKSQEEDVDPVFSQIGVNYETREKTISANTQYVFLPKKNY